MALRDEIVSEASLWLGTPYRHGMRHKGLGVDCLNLLIGIYQAIGVLGEFSADPYPSAFWRKGRDLIHKNMDRAIEALNDDIESWCFWAYDRDAPDPEMGDFTPFMRPGDVVTCGLMKKIWIPTHTAIVTARRGDEITLLHANQGGKAEVIEETLRPHWRLFRLYRFTRVGEPETTALPAGARQAWRNRK